MAPRARVLGCGAYLPERVVSNRDMAEIVDTSDEWIQQRTGIRERRLAADGELTSDLGLKAAEQALERAGLAANDLDLIICATSTPDETFPATATRIQAGLGMTRGAAFDVQAVCSGFVYGLSVADIAEKMNMPIGSIGPLRARCLKKLRKILLESAAGEPEATFS